MSLFEFPLPDIGEGVAEGEIVEWKVAEGDAIADTAAVTVAGGSGSGTGDAAVGTGSARRSGFWSARCSSVTGSPTSSGTTIC